MAVTSGPGALNALTGLASAWCDGLPVLLLIGEVPRIAHGKGVLQDGSNHGLKIVEMTRPITKMSTEVPRPSALPHLLRGAIETALSDRRGPVVLTLPLDVATAEIAKPAFGGMSSASHDLPDATIDEVLGLLLARRKRTQPADDLTSELVAAELDGRSLTEGEFQAFFMLLFNAGTDTTRSLLCYGLDLLLDRPEVTDRLRRDPSRIPAAIEEMLRYESPVIQIRRTATHDVELAGRKIAEGDKVVVFFPSANRDETVFADPDRFDIDRSPNDHIAFGFGAHHCLGAPLARLESRHLFAELLAQLPELERAAPAVPARTNFVRALHHLEIRFGPV